jgi:tRNA pseudouridine13 synthase
MDSNYACRVFARAWPSLAITAGFKQQPEDFRVDEVLPFGFSGAGEHLWLQIRKRGVNTDWLAQKLGLHAGVKPVAIGYAGLKDRHAVTTQWFSIHLPGQPDPDFSALLSDDIQILQQLRHSKKLQRGALSGNRFEIRLRNVGHPVLIDDRCRLIASEGVPNYFGEQRFGHGRGNLLEAERMFSHARARPPRHKRSLYLSAGRSWLFNEILSRRIQAGSWNKRLAGEVFMLDGKSACFRDDDSATLDARLRAGEIHLSAALWGEGESMSSEVVYALEESVAADYPVLSAGLVAARVEQQRRALRLIPRNLQWTFDQDDCIVSFDLPAGSYATTVLRELVDVCEPRTR